MLNGCLVLLRRRVLVVVLLGIAACAAPSRGGERPGGADPADGSVDVDPAEAIAGDFPPLQCTLAAPALGPAWLRQAVGYQIWVRSFADSDGDGHGDLDGIVARLDALADGKAGGADLDVDVLWLSPIFVSPSDHGYDATDYLHVQPQFGGDAALGRLLKAAKARGVRVFLDLVLNHTSDQHPWFLDARQGKGAEHRHWYVWRDAVPPAGEGWGQPWNPKAKVWHDLGAAGAYYGLFWSGMPDLNLGWAPVREALDAVVAHWVGLGVDGFRLDAVRYLVESGPGAGQADTLQTHAWLKALRQAHTGVAWVGEAWTDTATVRTYLQGDELDGAFDFDTAAGLRKGLELHSAALLRNAICKGAALPEGGLHRFAGNHDMPRLADLAGTPQQRVLALAATLLLPGPAWIYQGDELGLPSGEMDGDRAWRLPLPWQHDAPGLGFSSGTPWLPSPASYAGLAVDLQDADATSLRARVRDLVALRRALPALAQGPARVLLPEGESGHDALMWFAGPSADVLVVLAFTDAQVPLPVGFEGASVRWTSASTPGRARHDGRERAVVQGPGAWVLQRPLPP